MDGELIRRWAASEKLTEQIAAFIARMIESGQIGQWEPLPDNNEMADDFGVSVPTVVRAKRLLAENGAAEKVARVYVRS